MNSKPPKKKLKTNNNDIRKLSTIDNDNNDSNSKSNNDDDTDTDTDITFFGEKTIKHNDC